MKQRSMTLLALSLLPFTAFAVGCDQTGAEDGDGRDDAFVTSGKADGGIAEGSSEAQAVLHLVNTASFEVLDASAEVGLDIRAADGIVSRRIGADGTAGTDDDVPFETLAQLDAVPWVGPSAFRKLLAYALEHGYGTVDCDDGVSMLDRCYGIDDEQVAAVTTARSYHVFPINGMRLHHAANGFTVSGSQDLYESPSWVTRGIQVRETPEGWEYAASGADTYVIDGIDAPDGTLEPLQIGSSWGHRRTFLSAGDQGCDARDIGQISTAYSAYGPSGDSLAAALIAERSGITSLRACEDGEWQTVRSSFDRTAHVGVRFTATGEPQVVGVSRSTVQIFERSPLTGWERILVHSLENGTHGEEVDFATGPDGLMHVYVGTRTFTDDRSTGDLSVERVVLDDAGVVESVLLFDGEGSDRADARGTALVQAGIDDAGREFVALDRRGSGSQHFIDLIAYDPAQGPVRTTIDNYTTEPGHRLNVGFAVAPEGTLALALQSLGDPLRVRRFEHRRW